MSRKCNIPIEVKSSLKKAAPTIKSHNQRAPDLLSVTSDNIRKYFTESNESPDNKNANLGSPRRIENGGQRQGDFNEFLWRVVIQAISCRFIT